MTVRKLAPGVSWVPKRIIDPIGPGLAEHRERRKAASIMPLYEHVFMCRHDISQAQVENHVANFRKIIEEGQGKVGKVEYWGLKNLAYKIKKNRKAHYTLMNIDAPHEAVAEMERQMRLSDDILRFLTLRVEAHDEDPSPMMRADRDDRRGRRGGRDRARPSRERDETTVPDEGTGTE